MNKKTVFAVGLAAMVIGCHSSYGGIIDWGSSAEVLHDRVGDLLPRSDVPEQAGFIQLLHLGETGRYDYSLNDLVETGGDGTMGDDRVIAQSWVGERGAPFFPDGSFTAGDRPVTDPYTSGEDSFAIRVFDTPSPEYGDGFVWNDEDDDYTFEPGDMPTAGYYNYIEFIEPQMDADNRYHLVVEDHFATTIGEIPEPASLVLIALAGLIMAFRRRPLA